MEQEKYLKAFVELNEIINRMHKKLRAKIPSKLIEDIKKAGDKNYKFNWDDSLSLSEQNFLPETKSLLSVIWSDYLCSEEERKKWEEYDRFEMLKIEEKKMQMYNPNNLFKNVPKK